MRQIRQFRSNFENIYRDCHAIVPLLLHDSLKTLVRLSQDVPTNVAYFYFHSSDSCERFMRVSPDIYTIVA